MCLLCTEKTIRYPFEKGEKFIHCKFHCSVHTNYRYCKRTAVTLNHVQLCKWHILHSMFLLFLSLQWYKSRCIYSRLLSWGVRQEVMLLQLIGWRPPIWVPKIKKMGGVIKAVLIIKIKKKKPKKLRRRPNNATRKPTSWDTCWQSLGQQMRNPH